MASRDKFWPKKLDIYQIDQPDTKTPEKSLAATIC